MLYGEELHGVYSSVNNILAIEWRIMRLAGIGRTYEAEEIRIQNVGTETWKEKETTCNTSPWKGG